MIRESERLQLNAVLGRAIKQGFLPPQHPSFSDICDSADHKLFQALLHNPDHVLHQLLPPVKTITYELRPRAHDREIPRNINSLFKKSFMMKMIYLDSFTQFNARPWLTYLSWTAGSSHGVKTMPGGNTSPHPIWTL